MNTLNLNTHYPTSKQHQPQPSATVTDLNTYRCQVSHCEYNKNRLQLEITAPKQAEQTLQSNENFYQTLVNLSPVGLFRTNNKGDFIDVNQRWCELTGLTAEQALGKGWERTIHPEDREQVLTQWNLAIQQNLPVKSAEYRLEHPNGVTTWVLVQTVVQTTNDGTTIGYVGTITDISEHKKTEEKLRYQAWHDALTGLSNRALFLQRLEEAIVRSQQSNELFAVLFLDLNRFKVINDSLGHLVGDRLLCEVALRLSACLRSQDTVARLGGDEFTILLENINDINDVFEIASRLQKQLAQPFYVGEHQVFSSASMGIVLCGKEERERGRGGEGNNVTSLAQNSKSKIEEFPQCFLPNLITTYDKPEDILRAADTAMYRAKTQEGIVPYTVFTPQMYTEAMALLQLENDFRRAVENCQEFVLHYQPIFSPQTQLITGFEALVRWQHPTRGLVFPNEFIPLAEETGLIVPLGRYILSQAAYQLRLWQTAFRGDKLLTMSVNLSPKQFSHPSLVEQIDQILQEVGLEGSSLNLEITESALMDNLETTIKMLSQLRERGIHLSLDDFGTGYSSLSHLVRFPLNTLKIDRSFINQMEQQNEEGSMVWTIVTLAHNLGLEVVAEGVETEMQLEQLKKLQCEKAQGYFFSTPLNAQAATALLASVKSKQLSAIKSQATSKTTQKIISDRQGLLRSVDRRFSIQQTTEQGDSNVEQSLDNSLDKKLLKLAQRERILKRRLASQIRNSLDFNTILQTAINEIRQLMQIECCQFLWYRSDVKSPVFEPIRKICQLKKVCSGCLPPQVPTISVLGEALLEKKLLRVDDVATDPNLEPISRNSLQSKGIKSLLALTLHPNSGEVGVIVCEHRKHQHTWQEEEVELLQDMAEQLAIAIDHARLYEQSRMAAAAANAHAAETQKALQDLKQTQAQLIQSEKMSSLGLLVAGVAHEINNPVNFIHGNISYARQYTQDLLNLLRLYQQHYSQPVAEIINLSEAIDLNFVSEDLPKVMASMAMGTSRIQEIVRSLRNFSRVDEADMKLVNIHEGIDSTLLILQNRLNYPGIKVIKHYETLPLVECYAGQLNQVFMNILCNAIDALESYNVLRSAEEIEHHPSQIIISTEATPTHSIRVRIRDNGLGMSEAVQRHLFDPFFTTKPVGKGTGLGLSISYQIIVEKHQGKLECISASGEGTEFLIEIPVRQTALKLLS